MPGKRRGDPRDHQLLLRLTAKEAEVLEAAGFLGRETANGYAYKLIQAHLARLGGDPLVQQAMSLRAAADAAAESSQVVDLSTRDARLNADDDGSDDLPHGDSDDARAQPS